MNCPICGVIMKPTVNGNLFLCPEKRRIYLPDFKESINYYDCALETHAAGGYTFQQYEIPPYKIVIRSPRIYVSSQDTGSHVMIISEVVYDDHLGQMEPFIKWKEVFQTNETLELPWHDLEKCVQKLKLLGTFS
jgi:hypothetical protein